MRRVGNPVVFRSQTSGGGAGSLRLGAGEQRKKERYSAPRSGRLLPRQQGQYTQIPAQKPMVWDGEGRGPCAHNSPPGASYDAHRSDVPR